MVSSSYVLPGAGPLADPVYVDKVFFEDFSFCYDILVMQFVVNKLL